MSATIINKAKKLRVIQDDVVQGTTCFSEHKKHNVCCQRQNCGQWIDNKIGNNCVLITAQKGPYTLQDIGQMYNLTRMRICQLEKTIFEKVKKNSY